jgi:integration host factor subunit beta
MGTKKDLVININEKMKYLDKEDIAESVDLILRYLSDNLSKNNPIEIRGFGALSLRKRKYPGSDKQYNAIYYRMSKSVVSDLNSSESPSS